MNRIVASKVLDLLVGAGMGSSLWVEFDSAGWHVVMEEDKERLPDMMDFIVDNVRVKVISTQPALVSVG